jgi:uncharacterized protein YifN (PemK superfamily)
LILSELSKYFYKYKLPKATKPNKPIITAEIKFKLASNCAPNLFFDSVATTAKITHHIVDLRKTPLTKIKEAIGSCLF